MPDTNRPLAPKRNYDIQLTIKGDSGKVNIYSEDVQNIQINSSITNPWQVVIITMLVEPQHMMLEQVFGQEPIKLTINLTSQDDNVTSSVDFDLLFADIDFRIPVSSRSSESSGQVDRTTITINTVMRDPYKTMTTLVNNIYGAKESHKTIKEVIENLTSGINKSKLEYDSEGENSIKLDQVIIIPMPLINALKYLNNTFGIHNGATMITCRHDNKIVVSNLSKKIKKAELITFTHVAQDSKNKDIYNESTDGRHYYTVDNIKTKYTANSKFAVLGNNLKHIVKPSDKLYNIIEQSLEDVCKSYGIMDGKKITTDSQFERDKYYINHTGYDDSEIFANSIVSRKIYNMSTISFQIERNLLLENLLKVGEPILFKTETQEYTDLIGKYILFSTDITFSKTQSGWQSKCTINLVRTNKIK